MKFFYPTTTLNFDSILSSQMISPPNLYRPGTLWWNRHEAIVGERQDTLVLYSKCPIWEIDDPERDNYPMVIELDKSFAKIDKEECVVDKALKVTCLFETFTFSMLEIMQGKIRFLFRNKAEMERMLTRAITGVGECKIANALKIEHPETFDLMPATKTRTFKLDAVLPYVKSALKDRPLRGCLEYSADDIRAERERGAELGYQAGRNARFLRTGLFLDGYRMPITYADWKKKILPEPFSALIDKLCARQLAPWDPNRVAVAQFCKECWFDCFSGRRVDGKVVTAGTNVHASLQELARHWLSPEVPYRISAERNPYMQAFAAFLECGNDASKYPHFAKETLLKQPEYLLCLYGALVGYTSFSRVLLDNNVYLPQSPQGEEETNVEKNRPCHAKDMSSEHLVMENPTITSAAPEQETAVVQPTLFDPPQSGLADERLLLVCDATLCSDIAKHFEQLGKLRVEELTTAVRRFCVKYTDGYYGQNPEKYKRANPDLIDHMVKCFASISTPELNFKFEDGEEVRFISFLEDRYQCQRNAH